MIVFMRLDPVQIEHVDIIGAHHAQRIVEARDHALARPPLAVAIDRRLGRDHDLVARQRLERPPDHALGAVGRRGVDEVDAEIDRLKHQPRRLLLALAGLEPKPREPAGAKAGNADAEAGAAEGGVVHYKVLIFQYLTLSSSDWVEELTTTI